MTDDDFPRELDAPVDGEIERYVEKRIDEAQSLAEQAQAFAIVTVRDADIAAAFRGGIVKRRKAIEAWFAEPVAAAHAAHMALTTRRSEAIAPFAEPESIINAKLGAWRTEQLHLLREAQAQAADKARRLAEERQLAQALAAEQRGEAARAEAILNAPPPLTVVAPVAMAPAKVAGIAFVAPGYDYELVDFEAVPSQFKMLDDKAIRGVLRALKGAAAIPGLRIYEGAPRVRDAGRR